MITAIIPIDLNLRAKDIINKSTLIARHAEDSNLSIIFGHNDRGTKNDREFIKKINKFRKSQICHLRNTAENINTSKLRNAAFELVKTPYLILLDVDIYPDFSLYNKYLEKIKLKEKAFYIFPCLYLTKYGTKKILSNEINSDEMKDRFFSFSRKEFLHLASPSSITLMHTSDYFLAGGFDESFEGHGYEDFDFLIRLSKLHNLIHQPLDLFVDKAARSPLFAVGFRKYIGQLCLDMLLEKEMTFHLHHEKHSSQNYYQKRKDNYSKLLKKNNSKSLETIYSERSLINEFSNLCFSLNKDLSEYSILFENKPGHIDRYDTFKRRIKFLLNN